MVRSGCKPVMLVLIVLLAWVGTLPLASAKADLAPCHQSMPVPSSPESQHADHSCCAIGHGTVLPSDTMEIGPLPTVDATSIALSAPTFAAVDHSETPIFDSSPTLRSNLPIRI